MPEVKRATEPKRGRPPRISRDAIAAVARGIVDAEGIDALTMRRVADALQVVPMALYRHVADKDEILVLLLDGAYRELRKPRLPPAPRARLLALWVFLHDGLAQYPWVVQAIVRSDLLAPAVLPEMDAIVGAAIDCGLSVAGAADAYRVVWQYTVGELLLRSVMLERMKGGRPSMVVQTLLAVDPKALPALAGAARSWFAPPRLMTYEDGLRAILDGVLPRDAKPARSRAK